MEIDATWDRQEFPTRAIPLESSAVLGFAGLFWLWKEYTLSAGIVVAFGFFLRAGEPFMLRRNQVEFFPAGATVQLQDAKSSSHRIHSERLLVWDRLALQALQFLCEGLEPGDKLVVSSASQFRRLWYRAIKSFALQDYFIQPYTPCAEVVQLRLFAEGLLSGRSCFVDAGRISARRVST